MPVFSDSSFCVLWALETGSPKIPEGWHRREHTHTHKPAHTLRHANSDMHYPCMKTTYTRIQLGMRISVLVFISKAPSFFGESYLGLRVSSWARTLVSECWGRTMIWHEEPPCHLKQGHTERQLPPDTGAASVPVACWDRSRALLDTHICIAFPRDLHMVTQHTAACWDISDDACSQSNRQTDLSLQRREGGLTRIDIRGNSSLNRTLKIQLWDWSIKAHGCIMSHDIWVINDKKIQETFSDCEPSVEEKSALC